MTDASQPSQRWLGRGLSLFGAAALSWSVISLYSHGFVAIWALACSLVANVAWVLLIVLPVRGRVVPWLCVSVMVLGGGIAAAAVSGSSLVPVAVAVLWLARDIHQPLWRGIVLGVVAMLIVVVGDVLAPVSLLGVVALEGGVVVGFLAGQSRRQFLLADYRSRELVEEQARTDVLSARQHLAHDIHDVLAHSLGGLVIQLDAVDALLESGDTRAATTKIHDARALAAEGLSEARRAVAALREDPADRSTRVPGERVEQDIEALVDAHRSLGGRAAFTEVGTRRDVSESLELALRRAVQEGLTNARKHAPGAAVNLRLAWSEGAVEATISNPLRPTASATGGGHGLLGMRERFAGLPGGAVTSGVQSGEFVVSVKAKTT